MKLRIKDDSLRLRLTRTEVAQLAAEGRVESRTDFGGRIFHYVVAAQTHAPNLTASFAGETVSVVIPLQMSSRWARENTIGLYGEQPASGGRTLKIAVEKDFRCLDPNRDEDESDHFENPLAGAGHAQACDRE